jgi:hypothetical protein
VVKKGHTKVDELDREIDRQPVSSAYKLYGMPEWTCQLTTNRAKYLSENSGGIYHKNGDVPKNGLIGYRTSEQLLSIIP